MLPAGRPPPRRVAARLVRRAPLLRPTELRGLPTAAQDNAEVGVEMTRGWIGAIAGRSLRRGDLTRVCTHLAGVVRWNDAERSWAVRGLRGS